MVKKLVLKCEFYPFFAACLFAIIYGIQSADVRSVYVVESL